jgi:hypothetical protein
MLAVLRAWGGSLGAIVAAVSAQPSTLRSIADRALSYQPHWRTITTLRKELEAKP